VLLRGSNQKFVTRTFLEGISTFAKFPHPNIPCARLTAPIRSVTNICELPSQIVGDAPRKLGTYIRVLVGRRARRLGIVEYVSGKISWGKTYLRSPMNWVNQWHLLPFSEFLKRREKAIAAQAERYWVLRGRPEGSPEVDWFKAETEIDQQFLGAIDLGLPS
jgi:hypothetical protein